MIRPSRGERIFARINTAFLVLFGLAILFPVVYVLKTSLDKAAAGDLTLSIIPREFSLFYYRMVLSDASILRPFLNSIVLTAIGTVVSLGLETMGAYPLSKKELPGNRLIIYLLVLTMMFSGGLIPFYILVRSLKMIDRFPWVLILPFCISAWNLILLRNYYASIPASLIESARIDGASEFRTFTAIALPQSLPVVAAIGLFTGVNYWNTFFNAIIFINSPAKYTFAVKLREMLALQITMLNESQRTLADSLDMNKGINTESLYSAIIILSLVPIVVAYPWLQKHFVKGIMIGSIKA
jgi:putative aldouronate transport system permease protein